MKTDHRREDTHPMLQRIDHIDLKSPDAAGTVAFFLGLGFEVKRDTGSSVEIALPGDDQVVFEIREDRDLEALSIDHIAFLIDDGDAVEAMKARGVTFDKERAPIRRTGRIVSNFRDPAGGKWQLAEAS